MTLKEEHALLVEYGDALELWGNAVRQEHGGQLALAEATREARDNVIQLALAAARGIDLQLSDLPYPPGH